MNWDEEEHLTFYASLSNLEVAERSKVTLDRARDLLQAKTIQDELKEAESVLTYWKMNVDYPSDENRANTLFYHLYQRLGDSEKAKKFLPKEF